MLGWRKPAMAEKAAFIVHYVGVTIEHSGILLPVAHTAGNEFQRVG